MPSLLRYRTNFRLFFYTFGKKRPVKVNFEIVRENIEIFSKEKRQQPPRLEGISSWLSLILQKIMRKMRRNTFDNPG